MSDEEIAAIKKALEEMAEHNKKDLSDFKKYLKDEVVHGIQQTINENTQKYRKQHKCYYTEYTGHPEQCYIYFKSDHVI